MTLPLFDKAATYVRYSAALRRFLRERLTLEEAAQRVRTQLAQREEAFLRLLERAVYAYPASPYNKLLNAAGVGVSDVRALVAQNGLEGALERLHDGGVYVTQDEFKGHSPVVRNGIEFDITATDFDNPLNADHYRASTSGSRGTPTRLRFDFEHLASATPVHACFFAAHGISGRPTAVWRPAPPDLSGLVNVLLYARIGMTPERWFAQNRTVPTGGDLGAVAITALTLAVSRLTGRPLPAPEHVPPEEVERIISWLAAMKQRGTPAILEASASAAVRVCAEAQRRGIDISGSVARVGGEPFTPAKAEILAAAGVTGLNHYAMMEFGALGLACAAPLEIDDSHVLTDRIGVISRPLSAGERGETVPSLLYTTLQPTSSKLAINVESGDYGTLVERDCGCGLGELGLRTHVSGMRSYDKLTSEGVTFGGTALYELIETVLPARFGGSPTDYQLVEEEEEGGLPKVSVVVAPRVGAIDEGEVVSSVVQALRALPRGGRLMTEQWLQGDTLRVVRREPYATSSSKVLPLHLLRQTRETPERTAGPHAK